MDKRSRSTFLHPRPSIHGGPSSLQPTHPLRHGHGRRARRVAERRVHRGGRDEAAEDLGTEVPHGLGHLLGAGPVQEDGERDGGVDMAAAEVAGGVDLRGEEGGEEGGGGGSGGRMAAICMFM